jgi:anti-sigma regulatory factor (Ser/Thr protein kinase)/putative methionine-R-sulfoxide reductase with GAF domain
MRSAHSRKSPGERELGAGQVALELDESTATAEDQIRDLIRISDPMLSELEFDSLLDELLVRVRDLLRVDTAAILLLDPASNQLVARAAKGIEEEVERGVRIPVGKGFAGRIARERVAIFIADVDHADIMNPILREKGIRSLLGVPLVVEGELIGVLHVGSLHPRVFDLRDLAVLDLAAARAAPAIERGRLLSALAQEHNNALMLQRSLLPRRLASLPGVAVAARYIPARDEVGGDWYDAIALPGGQVGIAIGDVVGHGLAAASLMGQLRTALHAYALDGNDPGRTLQLVDRFARRLDDDAMATAAYAVVDLRQELVRFASAGHPPPILVLADGEARVIDVDPAPPLGTFGYRPSQETEVALRPGDSLFFYTDGLIERPGVPLNESIKLLVSALRGASDAEEVCLMAMDRLTPRLGTRDDVAVIAVQLEPVGPVLELERPARPTALAGIRRALEHWLQGHGIDREVATEIMVAVNEACSNAISHAYGPGRGTFAVRLERAGEYIEATVVDHGHWRAPRDNERGRGLKIMRAAMDSVDVRTGDRGTEVLMRRALRPL